MKKLITVVLFLVILAGAGYAAYRFGLLSQLTGGGAPGEAPSAENAAADTAASPAPGGLQPAGEREPAEPAAAGERRRGRLRAARGAAHDRPAGPGRRQQGHRDPTREPPDRPRGRQPHRRSRPRVRHRRHGVAEPHAESEGEPEEGTGSDRWHGLARLRGGATATDRADDEANTTLESVPFEIAPLSQHLWLVVDGRLAEQIDKDATNALEAHLGPDRLGIREFQQVVTGAVAFQAPAGASSLALLYLDSANGHLLLPLKGSLPVLASSLEGGGRSNEIVDLAVTARLGPRAAVPG